MTVIAVRSSVLREAYKDKIYGPKLVKAQTLKEIAEILEQFCKERGYRCSRVKLGEKVAGSSQLSPIHQGGYADLSVSDQRKTGGSRTKSAKSSRQPAL